MTATVTNYYYTTAELILLMLREKEGFEGMEEIDNGLLHEITEEIAEIIRDNI